MNNKKFDPLNVSSKFAICGLPVRVDTYKNCSFGCAYCFSNNRKICEFDKELQVGDIASVKRRLIRIFNKNNEHSAPPPAFSIRLLLMELHGTAAG